MDNLPSYYPILADDLFSNDEIGISNYYPWEYQTFTIERWYSENILGVGVWCQVVADCWLEVEKDCYGFDGELKK